MSMRAMSWAVVALLVAALLVTGGCPKKVKQIGEAARVAQDAQDGNFTVKGEKGEEFKFESKGGDADSGKMTVTGPDGQKSTTESGADAVKPEDVGIDFYPGATVEGGTKSSVTGEKGGAFAQVTLTTKDPLDKVASFYKGKYAEGNTVMDAPGSCVIVFGEGENKGKMISVTEEKGEGLTRILISAGSGM